MTLEDRIATLALTAFSSLPTKCKPRPQEWIPMTAIILQTSDETLHLASLATGSKCIPSTTLPKATGLILHDCHSEILALRGLNHFLLQDAHRILTNHDYQSPYLIYNNNHNNNNVNNNDPATPPFALHPSISIHLFSTEPPCGDASMEFIISAQEDPTPWSLPTTNENTPLPNNNTSITNTLLPGRSYFSTLSIVRRKPSRPDAPPTFSKSCTDKLTLKQFTSTLSSISSIIILPTKQAYIKTLTVPFDKFNQEGYTRAFTSTPPNGRLSNILPHTIDVDIKDYSYTPLTPTPLSQSFTLKYPYSKPPPQDTTTKASNIATLYINHPETSPITEVLISGVKQGNAQLSTARGDKKGSVVCRKRMWLFLRQIVDLLAPSQHLDIKTKVENIKTYLELKDIDINNTRGRIQMKHLVTGVLNGWGKNIGDDDWGL
ncbi:hypothetical protein TWF506_001436 [Arthrobotrys conoides]|uniref:A to I editase domain-containing protein n=1 Tax=Arthrobotrys conoides TaxID=74498 RepID=A0AAN8P9U3_9PEZI